MIKALATFLFVYGFLGIIWFVLKDSISDPVKRQELKTTLITVSGFIAVSSIIIYLIVLLF